MLAPKTMYRKIPFNLKSPQLIGRWKDAQAALQGQKIILSLATAATLQRQGHNSLIEACGGSVAELIGIISLANHSCVSPVCFVDFESNGTRRVHVNARSDKVGLNAKDIKPGQEIVVQYNERDKLKFQCQCTGCKSSEDVVGVEEGSEYYPTNREY